MKCPSCSGRLTYNIELGKLKCISCDSTFSVESYTGNDEGEWIPDMQLDTYVCRSCGAQLCAPEEQTVAYCMYCGSESTLLQKSEPVERPVRIIPFKVSKKGAQEEFEKELAKQPFVPKEMSDPAFLEGFRGIYIPVWRTKVHIPEKQVELKGIKQFSKGSYDYTQYYTYTAQIGGKIGGGYYDASVAFDDTIAAEIAPFHGEDSVPFREGYLAGFYSDKATTPVEKYAEHVDDQVLSEIVEELEVATNEVKTQPKDVKKNIEWSNESADMVLLPVWFLTWRKGKRVAYAVMNGQTGKMSLDVPVDYSRLFLRALIVAAVLFAILNVIPSFFIPLSIASMSSVAVYVSALVLKRELRQIRIRESHIYDWGDTNSRQKKEVPGRSSGSCAGIAFSWIVGILVGLTAIIGFDATTTSDVEVVFAFMVLAQIYMAVGQILELRGVKNKFAILPILLCVVIQISGCVVTDISRQQDFWYYGLTVACTAGMLLNLIVSVVYMNELTTRAVPNFFTREGADNSAK